MHTIYSGTTRNGVCIADMVDNNYDYVYRNRSIAGHFARFSQYLRDENDLESGAPAIAIFADNDPYLPILAKQLPEAWEEYADQYGQVTEKFLEQLSAYWEEVRNELNASVETKCDACDWKYLEEAKET